MEIAEAGWFVDFRPELDEIDASRRPGATPTHALTLRPVPTAAPAGLLLFSSGSTGKPRRASCTSGTGWPSKFEQPRPPIVAICFLMLDHFGGINTLLSITSSLGTVVTVRDRTVESICATIERRPRRGASDDAVVPEPAGPLGRAHGATISARST